MMDRVSKLPDEVLSHILSFLRFKEVAATSVLSKRWKPLWRLVPATLDFDDEKYLGRNKSCSSFISSVYATLLSLGFHQPIKKFSLHVNGECPFSDAKVWLNAVIQRQVQNLDISFFDSEVPSLILRSSTLVVLKLYSVKFDAFSSVDLPSLKTLDLEYVEFVEPQFLMELLYGCPVLENLEAKYITFDDYSFEGEVKSLAKLVRAGVFFEGLFYIPVKTFSNAQHLRIDECDADIPVFPNLIYLELYLGSSINWSLALDLLNHCSKLQTIVFNLRDYVVWTYPPFVPECFSSHLRECFLNDFTGVECQMRFVRYVMQNSTSLRTMTICTCGLNQQKKYEIIKKLASYPRSSTICELLFE